MILGIGTDLVEIQRISKAYNRRSIGFVKRILTVKEFKEFHRLDSEKRKMEWLSGRFAAKEALAKAVGTGIGKQVNLKDIEISCDSLGKPDLVLSDKVRALYPENTIYHLTITHTENNASAFVIIES
ncbi:holo-ACP synthase [Paenisporosarcina indica]|uniref:holo-ACP synthase n=1 Tax=Paenisporosarcina indica TaxID=650093 RepID=UPI00094F6AA3|nr:holo-ACP synthase [Paenisporosarcina indica]